MRTLAILLLSVAASAGAAENAAIRFVDAFDLSSAVSGHGRPVTPRRSVDGHLLTIAGRVYERGFGTRAEGAVGFSANGKVRAFDALVGLDDDSVPAAKGKIHGDPFAVFRVWADGKVVWTSGVVKAGQKPVAAHVDLLGAREIVLETTGGGAWNLLESSNCDWAESRFTLDADATLATIGDPDRTRQLGILTPPPAEKPRFNGADIWGVRPGRPVLFRVPVSGKRPMTFRAEGLPTGVTFDAAKGILGGVAPAAAGDYDIAVVAENAAGKARRTIRLAVGDALALTPPMGWNSWNVWCYRVTDERVREAARAMDASGLGDYGWSYVNIDDWWQMNNSGCGRIEMRKQDFGGREDMVGPARDAQGRINPNRSFPDMKALTDYVHSFGFKAGIYSSPGPLTCGRCEGSYRHELQDATRWAEWGFDAVKYDLCSYWGEVILKDLKRRNARRATDEDVAKPYRLMNGCLRQQKRDILFAFCQYGGNHVEQWARSAGANTWRSWTDLKDGWTWLEGAVESNVGGDYWKYVGPGCWADPDMMLVGRQYSFGFDHPTFLTPNEQYTHVTLWAMIGAPLLLGCDLTALDPFTRSLVTNGEVIDISQDRLGRVAKRIRHRDAESVWVRELADGNLAVAMVNRYPLSREISVSFAELGIDRPCFIRDCWRNRCEGRRSGAYVADVPPHATKLIYVKRTECTKCE